MAKGKRRSGQSASFRRRAEPSPPEHSQKPSTKKKALLWLGGIVTVSLGGVLTNIITNQAQRITPAPPAPAVTVALPSIPSSSKEPKKPKQGQPTPSPTHTGPPVIVEAVGPIHTFQDYSFVFPKKLTLAHPQLSQMNSTVHSSPSAYDAWFEARGGIVANQGMISLTIAGNSEDIVTVTGMDIVKHCQAPLHGGTLFYSPTAGGGPFMVPQIYFNLDSPITIGQYRGIPGPPGRPLDGGNFFAKKAVHLSFHEPTTLSIYVQSMTQYCQFTFVMHIASISGQTDETITNHGEPFSITSDGEDNVPFASYSAVFAGEVADEMHHGDFVQVNPATYHGTGDPRSFPPP